MALSTRPSQCFDKTWKTETRTALELAAGIQVSHNYMKYLSSPPGIAFRNDSIRNCFSIRIYSIAIGSGHLRKAGATAANDSGFFSDRQTRLKRPIGNLFRRRTGAHQGGVSFEFQCVGDNRFEDSARSDQRELKIAPVESVSAVGVGSLEHGPNLGAVNEVEAVGRRDFGGCRGNCSVIGFRQSGSRLGKNGKQLLNNFSRCSALRGGSIRRTFEERLAEGPRQPVRFAAPGKLVNGYATIFLPAPSGRNCCRVGGVGTQSFTKLLPTANQARKVREIGLNLGLETLFHSFRFVLRRFGRAMAPRLDCLAS
jgi:hypothetical protein